MVNIPRIPSTADYVFLAHRAIYAKRGCGGDFRDAPWARKYSERTIGMAKTLADLVTKPNSNLRITEILEAEGMEAIKEAIDCMEEMGMPLSSSMVRNQLPRE